MKRNLTHILLTAGLAASLGSVMATAQQRTDVAEIPFAFQANDRLLPAGTYTLREYKERIFLVTDNAAHAHSAFVSASEVQMTKSASPKLKFRCFGNQRVLAEIWTTDGRSYEVSQSSVDKSIRKLQLAAVVEVPLKQR
jgi:hypothetical protein